MTLRVGALGLRACQVRREAEICLLLPVFAFRPWYSPPSGGYRRLRCMPAWCALGRAGALPGYDVILCGLRRLVLRPRSLGVARRCQWARLTGGPFPGRSGVSRAEGASFSLFLFLQRPPVGIPINGGQQYLASLQASI